MQMAPKAKATAMEATSDRAEAGKTFGSKAEGSVTPWGPPSPSTDAAGKCHMATS